MVNMSNLWLKLLWVNFSILLSVAREEWIVRLERKSNEKLLCHFGKSEEEIDAIDSQEKELLKDLPCASLLSNPCPWDFKFALSRSPSTDMDFLVTFFRDLSIHSTMLRDDLIEMKQKYSFCSRYETTNLPNIPTQAELKEMTTEEALRVIHHSLLVHLAQIVIADYKLNYTDSWCFSRDKVKFSAISDSFYMILEMSRTACGVHARMNITDYEPEDVAQLLNEQISKPSLCIEGTLLFCLVNSSSQRLLKEIAKYSREQMKDIDPVEYRKSADYRHFWSMATPKPVIAKPVDPERSRVYPAEL